MISGLHSCKKENTPYVGDVKTFVLEERTGKSGKAWTKIRSAGANDGGRPYEVMSVTKTDYTDAYNNISFNLEVEPVTVSESRSEGAKPRQDAGSDVVRVVGYEDRGNRIERQHSQHMAILWFAHAGRIEDLSDLKKLHAMIDWFQKDIGRAPAAKVKAKPAEAQPEPDEAEAMPTDGEVDF